MGQRPRCGASGYCFVLDFPGSTLIFGLVPSSVYTTFYFGALTNAADLGANVCPVHMQITLFDQLKSVAAVLLAQRESSLQWDLHIVVRVEQGEARGAELHNQEL